MQQRKFQCMYCGTAKTDLPQIKQLIWGDLDLGPRDLLCWDCFEKRLGRDVSLDDFESCLFTSILLRVVERCREGRL
jgi:hypothetical protein